LTTACSRPGPGKPLGHFVHHLGLALGGQPAASFALRLMLPVSYDTLLRVVRRHGSPCVVPPIVIGIDSGRVRVSVIAIGYLLASCVGEVQLSDIGDTGQLGLGSLLMGDFLVRRFDGLHDGGA